jgi:hypothetical protein
MWTNRTPVDVTSITLDQPSLLQLSHKRSARRRNGSRRAVAVRDPMAHEGTEGSQKVTLTEGHLSDADGLLCLFVHSPSVARGSDIRLPGNRTYWTV